MFLRIAFCANVRDAFLKGLDACEMPRVAIVSSIDLARQHTGARIPRILLQD